MSLNNQIIVQSVNKAVEIAKINGILDLKTIYLYYSLSKSLDFTTNDTRFIEYRKIIKQLMDDLKGNNPLTICNFKSVSPASIITTQSGNPQGGATNQNPYAEDFTVTRVTNQTFFGSGETFPTYNFKVDDFLTHYDDTNDKLFHSIVIFRDDLSDGGLKRNITPTTGNLYGESTIPLEIPSTELEQWSWYTSSTTDYIHTISFKIIDRVAGSDYSTQTRILTIDRTANVEGNQPPTIGDNTIEVGNRVTTIITLAMVTSDLTPPYNDPEGDDIDAIRVVEISTANKGALYLDGVLMTENSVVLKQQIVDELFVHIGPDQSDGWADSFRFQARDTVNGQWVD